MYCFLCQLVIFSDYLWQTLKPCDGLWQLVVILDSLWWGLMPLDSISCSVTGCDVLWQSQTTCDGLRQPATDCHGLWQSVTDWDGLWWSVAALCLTNVDANWRHVYVCTKTVVFMKVNYHRPSEPCASLRHFGLTHWVGDASVADAPQVTQRFLARFTVSTRVATRCNRCSQTVGTTDTMRPRSSLSNANSHYVGKTCLNYLLCMMS